MKIRNVMLAVALLGSVSGFAQADASSYPSQIGEKFAIGLTNAATGWVEIPKTMYTTTNQHGLPMGMTAGFFKGVVHTVGRTVTGGLDVATFMIPTKPITQPAVIWEDFDVETTYGPAFELQ